MKINNSIYSRDYDFIKFRDILEKWADDNGIKSAKELSGKIGYSDSFCAGVLRASSIPARSTAIDICFKLGLPMDGIFASKVDIPAPPPKAKTEAKTESKTYSNSICPVNKTIVKPSTPTSSAKWKIGLTVDESSSRPNVCVTLTKHDQVVGYKYAEIKTDKGLPENEAVAQAISYAMHWIYKMEQDKSFRKGGQR